MKPLFTVHAGEYLVGSYIEQHFRRVNVWIPVRDTGIDLLASDSENHRTVSLQVKFSKDFLPTHMGPIFQKRLRACGWWAIKRDKLRKSQADFWVFALHGFASEAPDFIVVPPQQLWRRLLSIHGQHKIIQTYLWVTERGQCWETRGLGREDQRRIADGEFCQPRRDLTEWLNNWTPIARINR